MAKQNPIPEYKPQDEYLNCSIVRIRKLKGRGMNGDIQANLVDKNGNLLISATLDYIVRMLAIRLPK